MERRSPEESEESEVDSDTNIRQDDQSLLEMMNEDGEARSTENREDGRVNILERSRDIGIETETDELIV